MQKILWILEVDPPQFVQTLDHGRKLWALPDQGRDWARWLAVSRDGVWARVRVPNASKWENMELRI